MIKVSSLIDDEDKKAEEIDRFVEVRALNHNYLFGDAKYARNKARNENLQIWYLKKTFAVLETLTFFKHDISQNWGIS